MKAELLDGGDEAHGTYGASMIKYRAGRMINLTTTTEHCPSISITML